MGGGRERGREGGREEGKASTLLKPHNQPISQYLTTRMQQLNMQTEHPIYKQVAHSTDLLQATTDGE